MTLPTESIAMESLLTGLDVVLRDPPPRLQESRAFGLLSNQASVTDTFEHAADALHERFPEQLTTLFGPQHGLWSTEQDNMIETGHAQYRSMAVHSLYSETRKPTAEMLRGLDLLVVDLQDVGTRVYTYIWTLTHCMEACAAAGVEVMVLDRPNPLGGEVAEGAALDQTFASFVGRAEIPMRHGLTIGELARHCNVALGIHCELHVVKMRNWQRSMLWTDTQRIWVPPSPNLPRIEGALVYPGQVLLEGTNVSEGRGTTTPFEQFGAPWINARQLRDALPAIDGARLRTITFEPTFQKWQQQPCHGLFLHITDPGTFRSYEATLRIMRELRRLYGDQFAWNPPPYEYEPTLMPMDILTGASLVRQLIDDNGSDADLIELSQEPADWWQRVRDCLLY
ncbi:MAG: hypothetical protein ACI85K_002652 [Hyphomicrobiaceae bacterium]|jgi:uncharacterized protein YbbC (DUF1343 family)